MQTTHLENTDIRTFEGAILDLSNENTHFHSAIREEAEKALEGYVYSSYEKDTTPLFRFRDDRGYFYTADASTLKRSLDNPALSYEGITGYVYLYQANKTTPLFKLHNEYGELIYTASSEKKRNAMKNGFVYDGILCYIGKEPLE
ncbi:MAG: hypothetical protein GY754_31785 [bacterium]|nr:hypothetical protein [bacterium]